MSEPRSEIEQHLDALAQDVGTAIEQAEAAVAAYDAIDTARDLLAQRDEAVALLQQVHHLCFPDWHGYPYYAVSGFLAGLHEAAESGSQVPR